MSLNRTMIRDSVRRGLPTFTPSRCFRVIMTRPRGKKHLRLRWGPSVRHVAFDMRCAYPGATIHSILEVTT